MKKTLSTENFFAEFGIEHTLQHLQQSKHATYATVLSDLDRGSLRMIVMDVQKTFQGYRIRGRYVFHTREGQTETKTFLNMRCTEKEKQIAFDRISIHMCHTPRGERINLHKEEYLHEIAKVTKSLFDSIANKNEWINPIELLDKSGLPTTPIGRRSWPGLYVDGTLKSKPVKKREIISRSVYPAFFLPAILGVGPESYARKKYHRQSLVLYSGDKKQESFKLSYEYKKGRSSGHFNLIGKITVLKPDGTFEEHPFYEVYVRPKKGHRGKAEIKSLLFAHPVASRQTTLNYHDHAIDLKNPKALIRIEKVIRNINRMIRAGDSKLIEDLQRKPQDRKSALITELLLNTRSYKHLRPQRKHYKKSKMSLRIMGGNNDDRLTSDSDIGIGANGYDIGYYSQRKDGSIIQENIGIDAGVLFHPIHDVSMYSYAEHMYHRFDKGHRPKRLFSVQLFTHRHKDHLGAYAYSVKNGYLIPFTIANAMTKLSFERDLKSLRVDQKFREEALDRVHVVDFLEEKNIKGLLRSGEVAGQKYQQWAEKIINPRTGKAHYYPVFKIGSYTIFIGPQPHSDPGFMYYIETPKGGHLHTGDWKPEDPYQEMELPYLPPLGPWLDFIRGRKNIISLSADSTAASYRKADIKTPTEEEVENDLVKFFEMNNHPFLLAVTPNLGSNIARLATMVRVNHRVGRKYLILDGKAVEDLGRDARKAYDIIGWAKEYYDVDVLLRTQKKAKRAMAEDVMRIARGEKSLVNLYPTGSQIESFASLTRALQSWLPSHRWNIKNSFILPTQGVIPIDDNRIRREGAAKEASIIQGVPFYLPETMLLEHKMVLAGSGHCSGADRIWLIEKLSYQNKKGEKITPVVIPVHGGKKDLDAHVELAQSIGARTYRAKIGIEYDLDPKKGVVPFQNTVPYYVGINSMIPEAARFFQVDFFLPNVTALPPPIENSNAHQAIRDFEKLALQKAQKDIRYKMAAITPLSLSQSFNASMVNGYISFHGNIPFGQQRYTENVWDEKRIYYLAAMDTETTGLDGRFDEIREIAYVVEDLAGKTRKVIQLFQRLEPHIIPSVKAELVTGYGAPDKPKKRELNKFLFFSRLNDTILSIKKMNQKKAEKIALKKQKKINKEGGQYKKPKGKAKVLFLIHNARFDNGMLMYHYGRHLSTRVQVQKVDGAICLDTRALSRAIFALCPNRYKVPIHPETKLPDHRLESLCQANNIPFEKNQLHGAVADSELVMKLFRFQYSVAPELIEQMIVNADFKSKHLLNDIVGMDTGFDGPHPVFSYISPYAVRPHVQTGCFVTTLFNEKKILLFNLKYDVYKYLYKSPKEIMEMACDFRNDVFEIISLDDSPMIFPFQRSAVPKETLDRRAGVVKRHLGFMDPDDEWQTIGQKLTREWQARGKEIFGKRLAARTQPDLSEPMGKFAQRIPLPEDGIIDMRRSAAGVGFNPLWQMFHKSLREYREIVALLTDKKKFMHYVASQENKWQKKINKDQKKPKASRRYTKNDIKLIEKSLDPAHLRSVKQNQATVHYHQMVRMGHVVDEKALLLLNDFHYSINKSDLLPQHQKQVENARAYRARLMYQRGVEEIESIETDSKQKQYYIGGCLNKARHFKEIKKWFIDHAYLGQTSTGIKEHAYPWIQTLEQDNPEEIKLDQTLIDPEEKNLRFYPKIA